MKIRTNIFLICSTIVALSGCAGPSVFPPVSLFDTPNNNTMRTDERGKAENIDPLEVYAGFKKTIKKICTRENTDTRTVTQNQNQNRPQCDLQDGADTVQLLKDGLAVVSYRCGVYFDELGVAVQHLGFRRKEISLLSAFTQGSMGLANQSAKAIANVGAVTGFTTSSMDNYEEAFLYTPDIGALRQLVFANMRIKQEAIKTNAANLTYSDVVDKLKDYESLCQPAMIRTFVNRAVQQATTTTKDDKDTIAAANLASTFGKTSLTSDQEFYLYWLQSAQYSASDDKNLADKLSDLTKNSSISLNNIRNAISAKFSFYSSDTLSAWDNRIKFEKSMPTISTNNTSSNTINITLSKPISGATAYSITYVQGTFKAPKANQKTIADWDGKDSKSIDNLTPSTGYEFVVRATKPYFSLESDPAVSANTPAAK